MVFDYTDYVAFSCGHFGECMKMHRTFIAECYKLIRRYRVLSQSITNFAVRMFVGLSALTSLMHLQGLSSVHVCVFVCALEQFDDKIGHIIMHL